MQEGMQTRYIIIGGVDTFLKEGCDPEVTAVPFIRTTGAFKQIQHYLSILGSINIHDMGKH